MYFRLKSTKAKKPSTYINSIWTPTISIKYSTDNNYKYTIVIPKKQGNAVKRNRIKRVIREIMRCNRDKYPTGSYMLYINKQCNQLNRELLLNSIEKTIKKISQSQNK